MATTSTIENIKTDLQQDPRWLATLRERGATGKVARAEVARERIRHQLADRDAKRAVRATDIERQARRTAAAIFPELFRPFSAERYNPGSIAEKRVAKLIAQEKPLEFVLFWGGGAKPKPNGADEKLLETVEGLNQAVQFEHDAGAHTTIIIADLHTRYNGYENAEEYFAGIETQATAVGIDTVRLSSLYDQWGIKLPHANDPISPDAEKTWKLWVDENQSDRRDALIGQAARYNISGGSAEAAAFNYTLMRHTENPHLAATFSDAVLLVPGNKNVGVITLPEDMPHLYLRNQPPWFQQ